MRCEHPAITRHKCDMVATHLTSDGEARCYDHARKEDHYIVDLPSPVRLIDYDIPALVDLANYSGEHVFELHDDDVCAEVRSVGDGVAWIVSVGPIADPPSNPILLGGAWYRDVVVAFARYEFRRTALTRVKGVRRDD